MLLYELKLKYERQTGEDNPGSVKETYLLEGFNCTDVETRLMEKIKPFIFGDCEVQSCKKVQYYDIRPAEGDYWYKGRVEMITVEDDGKETRKAVNILIQAPTIHQALKSLEGYLASLDAEIITVTKTKIIDVFRAVD